MVFVFLFVLSQDAHNCIPEFDEETAMFAVYDGHGGNTHIHIISYISFCSIHSPLKALTE